jgi:hypothetical protein
MLSEEEEKQLKKKMREVEKKILYKGRSENSRNSEQSAADFDF